MKHLHCVTFALLQYRQHCWCNVVLAIHASNFRSTRDDVPSLDLGNDLPQQWDYRFQPTQRRLKVVNQQ
jgi:hypothetical protein